MLTLFEELTANLNDFERDVVMPIIVRCFEKKAQLGLVGEVNSVKNTAIRNGVNATLLKMGHDYKLSDVKLRKTMGAVRKLSLVHGICSSTHGYYIAANDEELMACIDSLKERVSNQMMVINALEKQLNQKNVA